jgi:hypothetical protein
MHLVHGAVGQNSRAAVRRCQELYPNKEGFANLGKFSKILGRWNDPFLTRSRHTQHPFSINVWAGILGHTVHNVIEEYRENLPVETFANMWYMQDRASPCIHHDIFNYLNNAYGNNWIGRNGPVAWAPKSPDPNRTLD